jgi:hypothetical protein
LQQIISDHKTTTSEGLSHAQRGDRGEGGEGNQNQSKSSLQDKEDWKDKSCCHCQKKGHPSSHCRHKKGDGNSSKKTDDDKSRSSELSETSKTSSINKLQKKMKKSFAAVESKIQELEKEDSDIAEPDDEAEEASHFQCEEQDASNEHLMIQLKEDHNDTLIEGVNEIPGVSLEEATMLQQTFQKPSEEVLFKQNHNKKSELDLKNIMLFDSQSTMNLFCNPKLVSNIHETDKRMRLKSNGGTMMESEF